MKKCSKCKQEKQLSEFCKRKTSKDGLDGQCKECKNDNSNKYMENLLKAKNAVPNKKLCSRCGQEKESSEYYGSKRTPDGLRHICKHCWWATNKVNNDKRPRKRKTIAKSSLPEGTVWCYACESIKPKDCFYTNKTVKTGHMLLCTACKKRKRKEYEENNKETLAKSRKKWLEANPHKAREYWQRRYARMKNIQGELSASDIAEKYAYQNGECLFCGIKFGIHYHVDHILPVSRGGTHEKDNIQLLCPACNMSKSDKTNEEFLAYLYEKG